MSEVPVMDVALLLTAAVVLTLLVPYIVRAVSGPTVFDRLIGLNATGTQVSLLLVIVGAMYERLDMFVDIALALFLLNLVATLLIARYVRQRQQEERGAA